MTREWSCSNASGRELMTPTEDEETSKTFQTTDPGEREVKRGEREREGGETNHVTINVQVR